MASAEKPTLSIVDFKIDHASLEEVDLLFDVEVNNPNAFQISLNNYAYDFQINGNSFVTGTQNLETELEASSTSIFQIPVTFEFQELYSLFRSLNGQDETEFLIDGIAGVDVPILGAMEIPISKSGTIPVIKPPSISVQSLKLTELSLSKVAFEFGLDINNPNTFQLNVANLDYALDINGFNSISGLIDEAAEVAPKSNSLLVIPFEFNLLQIGMGAYQVISNREPLDYEFTSSTLVSMDLPFFEASTFNFDKSGTLNILD